MKKYSGLLSRASDEYRITRGKTEDEQAWKIRIIYSILGRMAMASLQDMTEVEESSVIHMKRRVETLAVHYKELFPELSSMMPMDFEKLSNEIYDIYLNAGAIYHKPNRVVMSAKTEATTDGIHFTRGFEIDTKQKISGLGTYVESDSSIVRGSLSAMFQLEQTPLINRWEQCVKQAKWQEFNSENKTEYLRIMPPFTRGYWVDKPDRNGKVSLLRTGFQGSQLYYLYKVDNGRVMASQLPQWWVDGYNYRSLSNACLCKEGVLPPCTYRYDGNLVCLRFGYLPPPAELYLWKLYTWPESITKFPSDFKRSCTPSVFEAIKAVMQRQGYEFVEE